MATSAAYIDLDEGAAPAAPAAAKARLYVKADGLLYWKDDANTEYAVGTSSASVATDAIWDAAHDLAVGSGANTAAKLPLGAANTWLGSTGSALGYAGFQRCMLSNSGVQSMAANGATKLTFDTELSDAGGWHSGSGTSITVPATGLYLVLAAVYAVSPPTGAHYAEFVTTGTGVIVGSRSHFPVNGINHMIHLSAFGLLTASDVVEIQVQNSHATTAFNTGHASSNSVRNRLAVLLLSA